MLLHLIFIHIAADLWEVFEGLFQIFFLRNLNILIVYELQGEIPHGPHEFGHVLNKVTLVIAPLGDILVVLSLGFNVLRNA